MKKYLHLVYIGLLTLFFVISVHSNWIQNRIIDELTASRLKDSLSFLVEQNESSVYDWASWDETVDLVSQKNKNYFDENFNQDTAIDFTSYCNMGKLVYDETHYYNQIQINI